MFYSSREFQALKQHIKTGTKDLKSKEWDVI